MQDEAIVLDIVVPRSSIGERLDTFLTDLEELAFSRSQLQRAIADGEVLLNGAAARKAGVKLREGDAIACRILPPPLPSLDPEPIPLDILFEDELVLVLDKPAGMVVHPAPGHPRGTLVNALLHHCQELAEVGESAFRPGIVHRLDRDTSGVMVVCKSNVAHRHLAAQFAQHTIERRYLCLCLGAALADEGTFDTRHNRHPTQRLKFTGRGSSGRRAITHFRVIERLDASIALVACTLETGRTHQIRMHLAEAGAPILGDELYGDARTRTRLLDRQALHADLLGFEHPDGRWLRFRAPLPDDLRGAIQTLAPHAAPA